MGPIRTASALDRFTVFKILSGDPGWIRTTGLQIRNLMLYPTELRDHERQNSDSGAKRPASWRALVSAYC